MKAIAFAKLGKSIKFVSSFSPTGGDNEPAAFVKALANNNPDKKIVIVGRSDFSKIPAAERKILFPHDNVSDIWESFKGEKHDGKHPSGMPMYSQEYVEHLWHSAEKRHLKVEHLISLIGQLGSVSIPGRIKRVDGRGIVTTIEMAKGYSAPISIWLNEMGMPWTEIINDPRYTIAQSRDVFNNPEHSLGQFDILYTRNHIKSFEDQRRVTSKIQSIYAGMETGFCVGREFRLETNTHRDKKMLVVLNEGHHSPYQLPDVYTSRYDMLREWILRFYPDVEIYGQWGHPQALKDTRFKGTLHLDKLQEMLEHVRYTLVIPIAKGWVTGKYIEMVHAGVLTFFHPAYDTQRHVPIPEYLRVRSPLELQEKIAELESDRKKYNGLLKEMRVAILRPEYYDGSFLSNTILKHISGQAPVRELKVAAAPIPEEPREVKLPEPVNVGKIKGEQINLF